MTIFTCFRRARTGIQQPVRSVFAAMAPAYPSLFCLAVVFLGSGLGFGQADFRRGDANVDGVVDIADASYLNRFYFQGGDWPSCQAAADIGDEDALWSYGGGQVLNYLFWGGRRRQPRGRSFQGPIRRRGPSPAPLTTPNLPPRRPTSP